MPLPRSGNQHQAARRRAVYSSPGVCPPVQEIGDSPETNPFSPTTEDTLHEDESACNETLPPSLKPLIQAGGVITQPFSHPQTLMATNYPHPKTMHQFNDQMQPGLIQSEPQTPQGVNNRARQTTSPYLPATPGSISSPSSSMHEINDYHNPLISGQEMLYGSSAASANASQDLQPTTQLEQSLSSTHTRSKGHHLWYHTQANSSQGSLLSEQDFTPLQASQYPTENSLSNESVPSKPTLNTNGGYIQLFTTAPPDFHRHSSSPAATSRSAQKQFHPTCFTPHASYPHKKTSGAGSTVSDSGVEMVRVKTPSAGPNSDIIEPWMSVSNELSWTQPRPRVTSVSTGVQTEGENRSEKAESPVSGSSRTSSSPQHPHDGIGNSFIAMQSFFT